MTRLREEDISNITQQISAYDCELVKKLGHNLSQIAAYAVGKKQEEFYALRDSVSIAVIPMSCGQGIINGFSNSVQKIIEFMGFSAFVTAAKDVGGLAEATRKGAKVIFLADDNYFVAINMTTGKVADNGEATGKGYAAALDLLAGGVQGRDVLVIGAGPVGKGAAAFMTAHGAGVFIHDSNEQIADQLASTGKNIQSVPDLHDALGRFSLLIDATPAADIIKEQYITASTLIAAPGIPLGVSQQVAVNISDRLIHDVLEIGTATMLFSVLSDGAREA